MKLSGRIHRVEQGKNVEMRHVCVTIWIDRVHQPTVEDATEYVSPEQYEKAVDNYDRRMKEYEEYAEAIKNLGMREVSIEVVE